MKPTPSVSRDQQVLGVRCPVPDYTCQGLPRFPAEHHERTGKQTTSGTKKIKILPWRSQDARKKKKDRFGLNTFLQQSPFNIIVFDTIKGTLHIS